MQEVKDNLTHTLNSSVASPSNVFSSNFSLTSGNSKGENFEEDLGTLYVSESRVLHAKKEILYLAQLLLPSSSLQIKKKKKIKTGIF